MRLPIILTVTLLAAGAAGAVAAEAVQPDRLVMPHRTHFEAGVECATCHAGVAESRSARDNLRPGMDVCGACHDVADDAGCAMCHTNVDAIGRPRVRRFPRRSSPTPPISAGTWPAPPATAIRPRTRRVCRPSPTAAPATPRPTTTATAASATPTAPTCAPPPTARSGPNRHGGQARADEALCATCHTQTTCQACHAGDNVRPRTHPLNFVFNHGVRARGNEQDCATCHGEPEFCSSCHVAERVLPDSHSRVGWVRLPDGGQHARRRRVRDRELHRLPQRRQGRTDLRRVPRRLSRMTRHDATRIAASSGPAVAGAGPVRAGRLRRARRRSRFRRPSRRTGTRPPRPISTAST